MAEWYPLYTRAEADDETAIEMGYFLWLLFFAISNVGYSELRSAKTAHLQKYSCFSVWSCYWN